MEKRPHWLEVKMKKLRRKYGEGICSEYYLETGIPQVIRDQVKKAEDDIPRLKKESDKIAKKAEKAATREYKKICKKSGKRPEDKIIFC